MEEPADIMDSADEAGARLEPMKNYKNFWTRNNINIALTMLGARTKRAPVMIILDGDWICEFTNTPCDAYYSDFDTQQKARLAAGKTAEAEIGLRIGPSIDFGVALDASIYGGRVNYSENAPPTLEPAIEAPEQVKELSQSMDGADLLSLGLVPKLLEWRGRLKAEYGKNHTAGLTVKGPGSMCAQICGMTNFLMWLATNPGEMKQLVDLNARTTIRYIAALRKATGAKVKFLGLADDVSGMMSAAMYREFIYPAHKQIFDSLAPSSVLRYLHNDSNARHILHHYRKLRPGAVNFGPDVPVRLIRERIPGAVIYGQVPPTKILLNGTPEEVRREALANVAHARADRGRIVLTSAGSINPGTSFDNLRALIQASRESEHIGV